jgi:hypothetical protein
MNPKRPAQQYDSTELSDRAALRTIRERRSRIIRTVLKVAAVVVAMALLLILNRDNQSARGCRARMEALAARLRALEQSEEDSPVGLLLRDPREMPDESPDVRSQLGHVYANTFYHAQAASRGQAGVCCCREAHERILLPSGRHVLLYDASDGSYSVVWMEEPEFRMRADELGFRALSQGARRGE